MLPFGVTIPATVPQKSEIAEGLTNYPVLLPYMHAYIHTYINLKKFTDSISFDKL
jgi:hypothetical protein